MKALKTLAISACMLVSAAVMAQTGQQDIRVLVDGDEIRFGDQQPIEKEGRILVPLRGVFQRLGATVNWDPSTQTITARRDGTRVKITIGQLDAAVDGQSTQMDVPATLIYGVTMVPLRFVSEALGAYVGWDQANREVDIKSSPNYRIPRRQVQEPPPTPPPVVTPPTPPPVVVPPPRIEVRPLRVVRTFGEMTADTVIPLTLDTYLSSKDSKPGDPFVATLDTRGADRYMDLPRGTQAYGTVVYVKRQHRRDPGVIQLRFDHLVLPSGRNLPVDGRLTSLDDLNVMRHGDGRLTAKESQRNDVSVFIAYGPQSSLIVALPTERPLQDRTVSGMLATTLDANQRSRLAHDLDLHRGTPMGLRLYESLIIPRD